MQQTQARPMPNQFNGMGNMMQSSPELQGSGNQGPAQNLVDAKRANSNPQSPFTAGNQTGLTPQPGPNSPITPAQQPGNNAEQNGTDETGQGRQETHATIAGILILHRNASYCFEFNLCRKGNGYCTGKIKVMKLEQIKPTYLRIDSLIRTLLDNGGDAEFDKVRKLTGMVIDYLVETNGWSPIGCD